MVRSLSRCRPQEPIITTKQHLQKVMIVQFAVVIQVKVVDHCCEVTRFKFTETILPNELAKLLTV